MHTHFPDVAVFDAWLRFLLRFPEENVKENEDYSENNPVLLKISHKRGSNYKRMRIIPRTIRYQPKSLKSLRRM